MRAVTVGILPRRRQISVRAGEQNTPRQIRMVLIRARVVQAERHVRARQIEIIRRRHRVRRHIHPHARQVVQQHSRTGQLDPLHPRQLRQRHQAVGMRLQRKHQPRRHGLFGNRLGAQVAQGRQSVVPLARKQNYVQWLIERQGLLLHRQRQQRARQLVIRLVRQHGPRPRHRCQQPRPLGRHAHQRRVVGDV